MSKHPDYSLNIRLKTVVRNHDLISRGYTLINRNHKTMLVWEHNGIKQMLKLKKSRRRNRMPSLDDESWKIYQPTLFDKIKMWWSI